MVNEFDLLQQIRANKSVKLGGSTIQTEQINALKNSRQIVNTQKQTFSQIPTPADALLFNRKTGNKAGSVTIDKRPNSIIEDNISIPFSKGTSAQNIIDAGLGKGFLQGRGDTQSTKEKSSKVKVNKISTDFEAVIRNNPFFNDFINFLQGKKNTGKVRSLERDIKK